MPDGRRLDGKPRGDAIHATAVSIGGRGLLIVGPSGAGKSRLAFALISASTRHWIVRLVGDDRIILTRESNALVARPHPRIAGFIERRGLGIVAVPHVPAVPVAAIINLGLKTLPRILAENFPAGTHVYEGGEGAPLSSADVLAWWRDACTTPAAKAPRIPAA